MRHLTAFLFFIICSSFPVFSQSNRSAEPERENQEKRTDWFYHVRNDPAAKNTEASRWEAYAQNKSAFMKQQGMPAADWKSCGPVNQGGRMISYAFDPLDDNILWAGSATGG